MNQAEWQAKFDEKFPEGCWVTIVKTDETSAFHDNSQQYLTDKFVVYEVDNDNPHVSFFVLGTTRDLRVVFDSVEERDYGFFCVTAEDSIPDFMLSHRLSDSQRQAIQEDRD